MNLTELKAQLQARPDLGVTIVLPRGERIPAHYHVTEVAHVARRFIDCGGTVRASDTCVLQAYFGSPSDDGHRLTAGKLAHILDLAQPLLPSVALPVEVEYEEGVIAQFPLVGGAVQDGAVVLRLGLKHTDCLAKDRCGIAGAEAVRETGPCCARTPAPAGGRCC